MSERQPHSFSFTQSSFLYWIQQGLLNELFGSHCLNTFIVVIVSVRVTLSVFFNNMALLIVSPVTQITGLYLYAHTNTLPFL